MSATVSRELYGQVAACAKVKDRSMSWVVREALKAHLG
ncbi:ribbon-helix-helix protein, CopG family [Adlercreutzia aquisgranensis]